MPRLSDLDRGRAIGLLDSGLGIKAVSRFLNVTPKTIRNLSAKYGATGQVKDLPRSGRPRVTTRQQDRFIINLATRNRTRTGNYCLKLNK